MTFIDKLWSFFSFAIDNAVKDKPRFLFLLACTFISFLYLFFIFNKISHKFVSLVSLITIPVLCALFLTAIVSYLFESFDKPIEFFKIKPEKELSKQGPFWFFLICPALFFLEFGYFVAWKGYTFQFDAEGLATFIKISTLPLGLLSLSLPLSAFVIQDLRSKQTAKQIEVATAKNNLDAFYSHRKEFFNYFDQIGKIKSLKFRVHTEFKIHPYLHELFFSGDPKDGQPKVCLKEIECFQSELLKIGDNIDVILMHRDLNEYYNLYEKICLDVSNLIKNYHLNGLDDLLQEKGLLISFIESEKNFRTLGVDEEDLIEFYRLLCYFLEQICNFSGNRSFIINTKPFNISKPKYIQDMINYLQKVSKLYHGLAEFHASIMIYSIKRKHLLELLRRIIPQEKIEEIKIPQINGTQCIKFKNIVIQFLRKKSNKKSVFNERILEEEENCKLKCKENGYKLIVINFHEDISEENIIKILEESDIEITNR